MSNYIDRNPEREGEIIGAIMSRGVEALECAVSGGLMLDHFTDPVARRAFNIASILAAEGKEINLPSIINEMQKRNLVDNGDVKRLTEFWAVMNWYGDLTPYVSEVVEYARKRKLILAASDVAQGKLEAIDALRDALEELEPNAPRTTDPLTWRIRSYIEATTGIFTTFQTCADLGITDPKDKTKVRVLLHRFRGNLIEPATDRTGTWRKIDADSTEMDFRSAPDVEVDMWLPLYLHDCAVIHPGNIIVITGDPNAGKTAFLLRLIRENLFRGWRVNYFNSEMGVQELRKRLNLFSDGFPMQYLENKHFRCFERAADFHDVIQPGEGILNVIDYMEVSDKFYEIGGFLTKIHQKLNGAIAVIAIQKRDKHSDMPLGAQRALEKPRLAVALKAGNPNEAVILKCKNRKVSHNLDGYKMEFKLINGCEFQKACPDWHS